MVAKSILASGLLFVASAIANNDGAVTPTPATGPDGNMVSVQVVQVSDMNSTLKFFPEEIKAEAGSMVQFQFYPKVSRTWLPTSNPSTDTRTRITPSPNQPLTSPVNPSTASCLM